MAIRTSRRLSGQAFGKRVAWAVAALAAVVVGWPLFLRWFYEAMCTGRADACLASLPMRALAYGKPVAFVVFVAVVMRWSVARLRDAGQSALIVVPAAGWLIPTRLLLVTAVMPFPINPISTELAAYIACLLALALQPTAARDDAGKSAAPRNIAAMSWIWMGYGALVIVGHVLLGVVVRDPLAQEFGNLLFDAVFALVPLAVVGMAWREGLLTTAMPRTMRGLGIAAAAMSLVVGVSTLAATLAGVDPQATLAIARGLALTLETPALLAMLFLAGGARVPGHTHADRMSVLAPTARPARALTADSRA